MTDKELADTLIEVGNALKVESKTVIGECNSCMGFILNGEEHKCN